ncbi:hypothetical protein O3M35_009913 [Rhynocoris fuscipes]|uniref:ribonuclease H n=1 Tax=Rhynocoris fuscipes TaxID=488301 RepID=A0AAW1D7E0_9HEMI
MLNLLLNIIFKINKLFIKEKYESYKFVYTDGSKTELGTGYAIYSDGYEEKHKLLQRTSIFTAELLAISRAVEVSLEWEEKNIVLGSDSLSALRVVENKFTENPIAKIITENINERLDKNIMIMWIPGHTGIKGNEAVDRLAREAAHCEDLPIDVISTKEDIIAEVRSSACKAWQREWTALQDNKMREIRPTVAPWRSSVHGSRREEVVLTRLRIGHTRLTHGYLMARALQPLSLTCSVSLTIKHIFTSCSQYQPSLRLCSLPSDLSLLLSDSSPRIPNLISFLQSQNLYPKI